MSLSTLTSDYKIILKDNCFITNVSNNFEIFSYESIQSPFPEFYELSLSWNEFVMLFYFLKHKNSYIKNMVNISQMERN